MNRTERHMHSIPIQSLVYTTHGVIYEAPPDPIYVRWAGVWCSRWCRQLINFISCASTCTDCGVVWEGIIPDYLVCIRVCSHIQSKTKKKNYLLLWHWTSLKYSSLSSSSSTSLAMEPFYVWKALKVANGDRYMHHPFAHLHSTIERQWSATVSACD